MPEKIKNSVLNLRKHVFETGQCEYCRYFQPPIDCKVLVGDVSKELVCDAFQGGKDYEAFEIDDDDIKAFGVGMKRMQPYQHKVITMVEAPVGWLMIIQDTMKPKPHRFSLNMPFSVEHLSREHHWTQIEVTKLIKLGKFGGR